jgi:hypothetical protein
MPINWEDLHRAAGEASYEPGRRATPTERRDPRDGSLYEIAVASDRRRGDRVVWQGYDRDVAFEAFRRWEPRRGDRSAWLLEDGAFIAEWTRD